MDIRVNVDERENVGNHYTGTGKYNEIERCDTDNGRPTTCHPVAREDQGTCLPDDLRKVFGGRYSPLSVDPAITLIQHWICFFSETVYADERLEHRHQPASGSLPLPSCGGIVEASAELAYERYVVNHAF